MSDPAAQQELFWALTSLSGALSAVHDRRGRQCVSLDVGTERLGLSIEDRGKRNAEDKLACVVLDLDGAIVRVSISGNERAIEVLGRAHGLVMSRHRIREVEAQIVVAQGLAAASDMKEEAGHRRTEWLMGKRQIKYLVAGRFLPGCPNAGGAGR